MSSGSLSSVPALFINFKTYLRGTGLQAQSLARLAEELSLESKVPVGLAVQAPDIRLVSDTSSLPVYAQHLDPIQPGAHTGFLFGEALKEAGAKGTLLNHAEHRLPLETLSLAIQVARQFKLETLVCAETTEVLKKILGFPHLPSAVAIEPPGLIGGNVSVSTANPPLISEAVELARQKNLPLIVGAGIKNAGDVRKSLELGAQGVLVASGIVEAGDQKKALQELLSGFT